MIYKYPLLTTITAILLLLIFYLATAQIATGAESYQTVPTRTPVPQPTSSGGGGGGGGGNNGGSGGGGGGGSQSPSNTATPVLPTLTPTLEPLNFALEPCGSLIFAADLGRVNVRSGPGTDYEEIREIPFAETVAVVGRAEFAEWWEIEFDDGEQGWVADSTGTVFGNNGRARLIDAPPLENGNTPTPGPRWQPTAVPQCPTLTPSPTLLPPTSTPRPSATPTTEPTATDVPPPTPSLTPLPPTASPEPTATAEPTVVPPTAAIDTPITDSTAQTENSSSLSGFFLIGFGLIVFGFVIAIVRRSGR